jgi:6-phosphogluconolactonase
MDFSYAEAFGKSSANGYERLLLDAMLGDGTLFAHRDGVEATWALYTPILEAWAAKKPEVFPSNLRSPRRSTQHPFLARMPWEHLELFFVDERTVPPTTPESNYHMTSEALLSKVGMKPEQIHRMQGELEPEVAAAEYEFDLRRTFRLEGAEAPRFDVVTLGMGDDGHTASLFPHTEAIHEMGRLVVANQVPQKDTWRITLTWPVINHAREVFFSSPAKTKPIALKEVFLGPKDVERSAQPTHLARKRYTHLDFRSRLLPRSLPPPGPDGKGHLEKTR